MQLRFEIPDSFWSLFRSVNREAYMEALLVINEEYQYSKSNLSNELFPHERSVRTGAWRYVCKEAAPTGA